MKTQVNLLFALLLLLTPTSATAGNFLCRAKPAEYLALNGDGTVFTSVENVGVSGICSMTNATGVVTPQGCAGWYSSLLAQRAAGRTVMLQYNLSNATTCSDLVQWFVNAPYFFISE